MLLLLLLPRWQLPCLLVVRLLLSDQISVT
jgi:hypothetical protein